MPASLPAVALQSWSVRHWRTIPDLIARLHEVGAQHVELCGFHVDPDDPPACALALAQLHKAGISVTAYGVHRFNDDPEQAERVFAFAREAGARAISADFVGEGASIAARLSKRHGIPVGLHNHGRRHAHGSAASIAGLLADHAGLGLYLDTAWMLDSGEDPLAIAQRHGDRLVGLHLKDFIFDRAGVPHDVVLGSGNLALAPLLRWLVAQGWGGSLTIEYEGEPTNPVPALRACFAAVRDALGVGPAATAP